ncbi:MAG: hypothetical protein PVJ40_05985 [Gammaproteobacteria bacterium]
MTGKSPRSATDFFRDATCYIADLDLQAGKALGLHMTRATYEASVFLDHRTVTADPDPLVLPLPMLREAAWQHRARRPDAFIFHTAFGGSTLLARALDRPGRVLSLREPYLLHKLCMQRRLAERDGRQVQDEALLADCLTWLARSFGPQEATLIKTTDSALNLAPDLLRLAPESRAIVLYQALPDFVPTMLKHPERLDYLAACLDRARHDLTGLATVADLDPHTLNPAARAAYVWLSLIRSARKVFAQAPDRVFPMSSASLMENPERALIDAAAALALPLEAEELRSRAQGPLFREHAKAAGVKFDPAQARARRQQLRADHGADIAAARAVLADWDPSMDPDEPFRPDAEAR